MNDPRLTIRTGATWLRFTRRFDRAFIAGLAVPRNRLRLPLKTRSVANNDHTILICSPHPDDESLVGAFPLRARQETATRVVNCSVTLGSNKAERARRLKEVATACEFLDFELQVLGPHKLGLDNVDPFTKENDTKLWDRNLNQLINLFGVVHPDIVLFPHTDDAHETHRGVHLLGIEAAKAYTERSSKRSLLLLETEYWSHLSGPNLMIGLTALQESQLIAAIAQHRGEISRNPYHLSHPGRMMDNVRRGSEVVGGKGGKWPTFVFAELYRVSRVVSGRQIMLHSYHILAPSQPLVIQHLMDTFR